MSEIISQIVSHHASSIEDHHIFLHPNIPPKKISSALEAYAKDVEPDEVLVLIDSTLSGNAKDGALLTATGFYARNKWQKPSSIDLAEIDSIAFRETKLGNEILINRTLFLSTRIPVKRRWPDSRACLKIR